MFISNQYKYVFRILPDLAVNGEVLSSLDETGEDRLIASTRVIIAPGYKYQIVKGIITNFHQPQSTLLLLVSAFVNGDWKAMYDFALEKNFRFLSYGDASLLL